MIGAVAGDIIGSVYEHYPIKTKDFPMFDPGCRFTDDSVLTVAVADAILSGRSYLASIREIGRRYPGAGYGISFMEWLHSDDPRPYNSWGNGSAMRVSPVGFAFNTEEEVLDQAEKTAEISHNHPEGIKGAQATALSVFLARTEHDREKIRKRIRQKFRYNLDRGVDDIRLTYTFDISCRGQSLKRSSPSLTQIHMRMRYGTRFHWEVTAIPWRASPVVLPRPFMARFRRIYGRR
jgi:ADP-ribosylglycohydrolase